MVSKQQSVAASKRPPNAGKGRIKGTPNKTTRTLKEAILAAAEACGEDGKGKGSLVGYLTGLARRDNKAFASLLGKVLPMTISGDPSGAPVHLIVNGSDVHG